LISLDFSPLDFHTNVIMTYPDSSGLGANHAAGAGLALDRLNTVAMPLLVATGRKKLILTN